MWLGVHLVYLPGLRNRLVVLLTWLQTYLLGDRPVRLILSPQHHSLVMESIKRK
jgi:NADH:ubiquinone reductase (H+-translocating)